MAQTAMARNLVMREEAEYFLCDSSVAIPSQSWYSLFTSLAEGLLKRQNARMEKEIAALRRMFSAATVREKIAITRAGHVAADSSYGRAEGESKESEVHGHDRNGVKCKIVLSSK